MSRLDHLKSCIVYAGGVLFSTMEIVTERSESIQNAHVVCVTIFLFLAIKEAMLS